MKTLRMLGWFAAIMVSTCAWAQAADQIRKGMPEAELLAQKGAPESVATVAGKSIYRYPDVQVTLIDGKVTTWRWRNPEAEQANAEERRRRVSEQQAVVHSNAPSSPTQTLPAKPAPSQPAYYPAPSSRRYMTKAEQIAQIKLELEHWRGVKERAFREISKPSSQQRISPAQRELADAKIAEFESKLAAAEALPD